EDSLLTLDAASPDPRHIPLTPGLVSNLELVEGVNLVSPLIIVPGQIGIEDLSSQISVSGVDASFFSLSGYTVTLGRSLAPEDQWVAVINEATAEIFSLSSQNAVGKDITVTLFIPIGDEDGSEMKVVELASSIKSVGVVEQPGIPSQAYLPRALIEEIWEGTPEYHQLKIRVENNRVLPDVREDLLARGLMVSALSEVIDEANRVFRVVQFILGIFGVFALIVAAIGLINTMTITLLERTGEIGIMRAVGADPRDIKRLFLTESVLTGFLGGLLGIVLGIMFAEGFNAILNIMARMLGGQAVSLFSYPIWFLVFILLLSSAVGLVAGLWPARRAARLDPLDALRYK
ncbi:MAG: FtsX-like permease family protein, partial [bacterium]|nr:FtsX-like permease family protein [bacterium]